MQQKVGVAAAGGENLLFLTDDQLRRGIEAMFFAYRAFTADPDMILADMDYGRAHHRAIHFVHREPGLTVTALLDVLGVTKQSLNRVLREQITGIRVVRAFVREPHEAQRFEKANGELVDTATRVGRRMMTLFPFVFFVMNVSTIGVTWFGAFRVAEGALQTGQLLAFIQYLTTILMSVMMATMMLMIAPRAAVSAGR